MGCGVVKLHLFVFPDSSPFCWVNLGFMRKSLASSYPVVGADGFIVCGGEVRYLVVSPSYGDVQPDGWLAWVLASILVCHVHPLRIPGMF